MKVFIHGLGCDESSLKGLADCLSDGGSTWIISLPKTSISKKGGKGLLESAVDEISAELANAGNLDLVAHSMGAAIALPVAARLAQRVNSVTIFEGNLTLEDCGLLSSRLSQLETDKEVRDFIGQQHESGISGMKFWATMAASYDPITLVKYAKELICVSESNQLIKMFSTLECSKLFVFGEDYVGHPTITKIPSVNFRYLKGTGHFAVFERPELCAECVSETMTL